MKKKVADEPVNSEEVSKPDDVLGDSEGSTSAEVADKSVEKVTTGKLNDDRSVVSDKVDSSASIVKNPVTKEKSNRGCIIFALIAIFLVILLTLCATLPFLMLFLASDSTTTVQEGTSDDVIAVIDVNGVISSTAQTGFFGEVIGVNDKYMVDLLDSAMKDPSIDAIILRIESPGGEAVASDIIAQKVLSVREEKPVVAYSATTAASGGYMIAAAADRFVVHPGVITGSIGVIFQTTNIEGLYEKLGISSVTIKSDQFKDTQDLFENPDGEQNAIFQGIVDESYDMFVDTIVEGRGMEREKVVKLGDGRLYTGKQAVENGLADASGYFDTAIQVTEELASLQDSTVIEYNETPSLGGFFPGLGTISKYYTRLSGDNYFGVYFLPDLNK